MTKTRTRKRPPPPPELPRLLYRVSEVATLIGMSRSKTYELVADGTIPSIKVGAHRRVPAEALKAWIDREMKAK